MIQLLHILRLLKNKTVINLSTFIFKIQLKLRGCENGSKNNISGRVIITSNIKGAIKIGDSFNLNSNFTSNLVGLTNKAIFQCIDSGKIIIGNNCGFSSTVLSTRTAINIANNVKIGGNVRIFDHDYHSINYLDRKEKKMDALNCKSKPVYIKDDVFIGTNVIILKGTIIGERSIIAAGSVVFGLDIPPDSLVMGNPAKVVKKLK